MTTTDARTRTLKIYYTTDIHGHFYPTTYGDAGEKELGLFKIASHYDKDGDTLIIDGGDLLQGTAFTNYMSEQGQADVLARLMNMAGYDYVTLGNHDFNYGTAYLRQYLEALEAQCLCQNILDEAGNVLFPWTVHVMENGLRVGLIGAVTDFVNIWERADNLRGIQIVDPYAAIEAAFAKVRAQCDVMIGIYHGGFEKDLETGELVTESKENIANLLCERFDFDVLLTGHQHYSVAGQWFDGTYVVQCRDKAGEYIELELEVARAGGSEAHEANGAGTSGVSGAHGANGAGTSGVSEAHEANGAGTSGGSGANGAGTSGVSGANEENGANHTVQALAAGDAWDGLTPGMHGTAGRGGRKGGLTVHSKLVKTSGAARGDMLAYGAPYDAQVQIWLDDVVGHLPQTLTMGERVDMALHGSALADLNHRMLFYAVPEADIAVTSLINEVPDLPATLRKRDIITAFPYPNTLMLFSMTGANLRAAMERSAEYLEYGDDGELHVSQPFLKPKVAHYNYDFYAGRDGQLEVQYDYHRPAGHRVVSLKFAGRDVRDDDVLKVVANNYRGSGAGDYPMYPASPVIREVLKDTGELFLEFFGAGLS